MGIAASFALWEGNFVVSGFFKDVAGLFEAVFPHLPLNGFELGGT